MTTSAKLLPCPFCGEEAFLFQWETRKDARLWRVGCNNNECKLGPHEDYDDQDQAIAAWNTRTPKDKP